MHRNGLRGKTDKMHNKLQTGRGNTGTRHVSEMPIRINIDMAMAAGRKLYHDLGNKLGRRSL